MKTAILVLSVVAFACGAPGSAADRACFEACGGTVDSYVEGEGFTCACPGGPDVVLVPEAPHASPQ